MTREDAEAETRALTAKVKNLTETLRAKDKYIADTLKEKDARIAELDEDGCLVPVATEKGSVNMVVI